jgi:hypothetical protein
MALELARTLRGSLAGAVAAGVWAGQQPLDIRAFGVHYYDTELLGKLVTRSRRWRPVGVAVHLTIGATLGGVYANVAHRLPGAGWARGALFALSEHLASWPGTRVLDAIHPAARDFPPLWGDHAAFAQAAWRHLLFGLLLGTGEERLARAAGDP